MQTKKESLMNKIVKRNFNDELEVVLEQKSFDENVKSILLSILYKIEVSYNDMENIKQDMETKEEYIEKLIEVISQQCASIKLVKMGEYKNNEDNDEENLNKEEKKIEKAYIDKNASKIPKNGTFYVNKQKKAIECYPIERKVLYCIWKLSKKDRIINNNYYMRDIVLSDLINTGNTIQKVETLRDFNGYSWTTLNKEIESVAHNLIYQNLRILVGNRFMENWVYTKEMIIDYYSEFINILKKEYGEEKANDLIDLLIKIAVILELKFDKDKLKDFRQDKESIEHELEVMEDKHKYVEEITDKKMVLLNKIKQIDSSINDKELLQKEYIKRNEELPLNKKIFSMRVLSNMMKEEKKKYCDEIEELNSIMKPKNFVKHKNEIEEKYQYLKILEINTKDIQSELEKYLLQFQQIFLKCFEMKIEKAETKQQINSLIYQFRYYLLIPFDIDSNILEKMIEQKSENEENLIKQVILNLVKKAQKIKAVIPFSKNTEYEYEIWKNIFSLRVIKLENLSIKLIKEKDRYFMHIFDEGIFEEKKEIFWGTELNTKELEIKLNKKIKIFE